MSKVEMKTMPNEEALTMFLAQAMDGCRAAAGAKDLRYASELMTNPGMCGLMAVAAAMVRRSAGDMDPIDPLAVIALLLLSHCGIEANDVLGIGPTGKPFCKTWVEDVVLVRVPIGSEPPSDSN